MVALHKIEIYTFSNTILQYEVYWDPGRGKVIADSVKTATRITSIFTKFLSILNVLSIYVNDRKIVEKMYKEGALMSMGKSHNIALTA